MIISVGISLSNPGPFVVATGRPTQGPPWPSNVPAIGAGMENRSRLDRFHRLDLAGSPFDAWNGTSDFWLKLISPGAAYPRRASGYSARHNSLRAWYIRQQLANVRPPFCAAWLYFLVFYFLLVGPVNYLVLRQQRRLHLAWITIPTITLIFSAASFGVGYLLHGTTSSSIKLLFSNRRHLEGMSIVILGCSRLLGAHIPYV